MFSPAALLKRSKSGKSKPAMLSRTSRRQRVLLKTISNQSLWILRQSVKLR
ncbi:Uncharacterised protein [Vibrio cholerae]|nr:Uncharacterised protein [Vibrio cholerae]